MSDREFSAMADAVRHKPSPREVPLDDVETDDESSSEHVINMSVEDDDERQIIKTILYDLLTTLTGEDCAILKLRYWKQMSVADVSRALHLDQKALYRRLETLFLQLKTALEARGVSSARIRDVLGGETQW